MYQVRMYQITGIVLVAEIVALKYFTKFIIRTTTLNMLMICRHFLTILTIH
jgi:hypothetical protein